MLRSAVGEEAVEFVSNGADFQLALALAAGADVRDGRIVMGTATRQQPEPDWLDKRIILQATEWVDRAGRHHRLDKMTVQYRTNVVLFLDEYESEWSELALVYVFAEMLLGNISSSEAARQYGLVELLQPGWIRQTPLVRRLLELNAEGAIGPG